MHDYKLCIHCHNFLFLAGEENVGVCRLNPPAYHDMTWAEVAEAAPFDGYPFVRPDDNCEEWNGIKLDPDLRVGGYAIVTADCFDSNHSLAVPADEHRLFRILGCPRPSFYEIVSTDTHRVKIVTSGGVRWSIRPRTYRTKYHEVVPSGNLTSIRNRFSAGDTTELTREILVRFANEQEAEPLRLEIGTPIRIKKVIAERGTYKFLFFQKWHEKDRWNRCETDEEVPDIALTVAREEYDRLRW